MLFGIVNDVLACRLPRFDGLHLALGMAAVGCLLSLAAVSSPAKLFRRYMDDIIRTARQSEINNLLERANKLDTDHLQFTIEKERDGVLPFLDIKIVRTRFSCVRDW